MSDDSGGFPRKKMAQNIPPELRDRRDWSVIENSARKIAAALHEPSAAAAG